MRLFRQTVLVTVVCAAGACAPEDGDNTAQALETLICPEGQLAWNFSGAVPAVPTSEGMSLDPNAVPVNPAPPRTISVLEARCVNGRFFTGELAENCNGRQRCITDISCDPDALFYLRFQCPGGGKAGSIYEVKNSKVGPGGKYTGTFACPQDPPKTAETKPAFTACVPEQCHGATRRNLLLQCTPDFARTTLRAWVDAPPGGRNQFTALYFDGYPFSSAYLPRQVFGGFDKTIDPDRPTTTNLDEYVSENWVLFPKSVIDLKNTKLRFSAPLNHPEKTPLKGRVVLWLSDEYYNPTTDQHISSFRCMLHSIDLQKYGVMPADAEGEVTLDKERFLLPTDCTNQSNALENLNVTAKKMGEVDLVAFRRKWSLSGTRVRSSFDLEGVNIFVPRGQTRETACAPNPLGFFYNQKAKHYDLVEYYAQTELWTFRDVKTGDSTPYVNFKPSNRTELGVSGVRVKDAEVRVKTEGRPRGGIRVDYDFYLAHDLGRYWGSFGIGNYDAKVFGRTYLVPKDAAGNQLPAPALGYTLLGETELSDTSLLGRAELNRVDGLGQTRSLRYPITDALRKELARKGSPIEIGETKQRVYEVMTCVQLVSNGSGSTREVLSAGEQSGGMAEKLLELSSGEKHPKPTGFNAPPNGCRYGDTPIRLRLDRAIAPLDPISDASWTGEATPQDSGDGRMSGKLDNDAERLCDSDTTGDARCNSSSSNEVRTEGLFGGTYASVDTQGEIDPKDPYNGDADASMLGFNVLDDEETAPWAGPGQKVTLKFAPPWDMIRTSLKTMQPALEWEEGTYAGIMGLGMGVGHKQRIFIGPVQVGVAIITVSIGVSIELELEWSADTAYPCLGMTEACSKPFGGNNLRAALNSCYATGGRLAELSSASEAQKLASAFSADTGLERIWLGAQVANEYAKPACTTGWNDGQCSVGHISMARWLTSDDEFAQATSFSPMSWLPSRINFPGATPALMSVPAGQPSDRGVVLNRSGVLELKEMNETHRSLCVYDPATDDDSHTFKATLGIGIAVGISIAFCTPNDNIGVCLQGSLNFVGAAIKPGFTYTYHRLTNAQGKKSTRSNVNFSVDWEVKILEGKIDVKLVAGPFELVYNLFTYNGLTLPKSAAGGKFHEVNWPSIEAFQ